MPVVVTATEKFVLVLALTIKSGRYISRLLKAGGFQSGFRCSVRDAKELAESQSQLAFVVCVWPFDNPAFNTESQILQWEEWRKRLQGSGIKTCYAMDPFADSFCPVGFLEQITKLTCE